MLGQLPSGYNKAVHGPYDPAVFYGKADIPLSQVKWDNVWSFLNQHFPQVKVYQLPAWLLRRQFYNPIAYGRAMSRWEAVILFLIKIKTLLLLLQSLLALEPQVRAAQVLRLDPLRPGGCGRLRPLLSPELQQHLLPQEHEVPLVIRDPVIIEPGDS